jgi:ERF superfamily
MEMSEQFTNIFEALCKFRGAVINPKKDRINPHFKSEYATLDSIITTVNPVLSECGLSFFQDQVHDKDGHVGVYTMLIHKAGEWIKFSPVYIKAESAHPQKLGAALTYAKRYSLSMALGIATDDDDDANSISPQEGNKQQSQASKKNATNKQQPRNNQPAAQKQGNGELDAYKELAEQNQKPQETRPANQRGRFFAVAAKRGLQEKAQKAIVFGFTGKESRKEVTDEEYKVIADFLDGATNEEIKRAIDDAVKAKTEQKQLDTSDPTDDEVMKLLGEGVA